MLSYKLNILYPRGGGGSWLSNLIWYLENENFILTPTQKKVFDGSNRSFQVNLCHGIEFDTVPPTIFIKLDQPHCLFSNPCPFNHYLHLITKVKYHLEKIDRMSRFDQFCLLTDTAVFILTHDLYKDYFYRPAELDYRNIFLARGRFIESLYSILDQFQIKYYKNDDFVEQSIDEYQNTCDNPRDFIGNVQSLLWLGFCHALLMIDDVHLNNIVLDHSYFEEVISSFNKYCIDRVQALTFYYDHHD